MSLFSNLSTIFKTENKKKSKGKPQPRDDAQKTQNVQAQTGKSPHQVPHIDVIPLKPKVTTPSSPVPSTPSLTQPTVTPKTTGLVPTATPEELATAMDVVREAQAKAREVIVEAKSEALSIRSKAENEVRQLTKQVEEQQRNLDKKNDRLETKFEQLELREQNLIKLQNEAKDKKQSLIKQEEQQLRKLEEIVGLTTDEARRELFDQLEKTLKKETSQFIRQKQEEAEAEADEMVREILVDAMKHGATDYVAEYTISVVQLPSEEAKGKIIGKGGKNINSFERATGVDVDLDVSPTEVRLSCFDPVRREIARISLERLIKDGRIQPSRIEETVAKVTSEIDKITLEAGKQLCHEVGAYNLPIELMRMLGKFKYRFSYGQNLIAHTLEETKIGIKLASELGIDVNTVKLGCLLHDIGKVSGEAEGSHVELGVKIAKRFNIPQPVIDCIAQHHEDEPFSGPEQMVVYIADAISGARPGARYENYDEYVARLQQLESIATAYDVVQSAYAIQAGREVRVLLQPQKSKDDDVLIISRKIRDEIKEKVTYPGTVTVTVIRETRNREVAN